MRQPHGALDGRTPLAALRAAKQDQVSASPGGTSTLIFAIVLTPKDEGLEIDVQGNLAGILTIASNAKSPRPEGQGLSQLKVVAGTRFHLNFRRGLHGSFIAFSDALPSTALFPGLFSASA